METKQLLALRKAIKKKKPVFHRDQFLLYKKLNRKPKWRYPRGDQSKIRLRRKGHLPHPCYGVPKEIRYAHPSGFFEVIVHNVKELQGVDPKIFAIRIAATVGMRKKIEIVKGAEKLKLKILNPAIKIKEKPKEEKKEKPAAGAKAEKMGFDAKIVPQVLQGKAKTYRVRDHNLKPGDKVEFENSQTGKVFGGAVITNVEKTTVKEIDLKDPAHGVTYKNVDELIAAFKRHKPDVEVTPDTEVFVYTYKFTPSEKGETKAKKKTAEKKKVK